MGAETTGRIQKTEFETNGVRAVEEWRNVANDPILIKHAGEILHTLRRSGGLDLLILSVACGHKSHYTLHYAYGALHIHCTRNSLHENFCNHILRDR